MPGIVRRLRQQLMITLVNIALITGVFLGTIGTAQGGASVTPRESSKGASDDQQKQIAAIKSITRDAIKEYNLKALIVQVTAAGRQLYTEALGESMSGVPATPAMHFRNGAMAFTYISTMLLELVDQKKVSLDDKLSKFLPDLPHADRITLKNLANMHQDTPTMSMSLKCCMAFTLILSGSGHRRNSSRLVYRNQ
jgi:CubicO group peptidase (beta-lactamase class C family)